jgi:hypothetical protein
MAESQVAPPHDPSIEVWHQETDPPPRGEVTTATGPTASATAINTALDTSVQIRIQYQQPARDYITRRTAGGVCCTDR